MFNDMPSIESTQIDEIDWSFDSNSSFSSAVSSTGYFFNTPVQTALRPPVTPLSFTAEPQSVAVNSPREPAHQSSSPPGQNAVSPIPQQAVFAPAAATNSQNTLSSPTDILQAAASIIYPAGNHSLSPPGRSNESVIIQALANNENSPPASSSPQFRIPTRSAPQIARSTYSTAVPGFQNTGMARRVLSNSMYLQRSTTMQPEHNNIRHYGFSRQLLRRGNLPKYGKTVTTCYLCSAQIREGTIEDHLRKSHYGSRFTHHTIAAGQTMLWRMLVEMGVCDERFAVQCLRVSQRCTELVGHSKQNQNDHEDCAILNMDVLEGQCDQFFARQWEESNANQVNNSSQ